MAAAVKLLKRDIIKAALARGTAKDIQEGAGVASTGDAAKRHSELWAAPIRDQDGNAVHPEGWPDADEEHAAKVGAALEHYERTGSKAKLVELALVPAGAE